MSKCCLLSEMSGEFCDYESFQASCNSAEILQILKADYGHMHVGKCIEADIGFLGCKQDVTGLLRSICDGKKDCEIRVDDQKLRDTRPCTPGIDVFLDVSFVCLKSEYTYSINFYKSLIFRHMLMTNQKCLCTLLQFPEIHIIPTLSA